MSKRCALHVVLDEGSRMLLRVHLDILCMCTWVRAWLFASPCTPRGGTIAGFCLAQPWEEGDRRVNEWRGFRDASAQGHDEGVGRRGLKLNNMQRNSHSVASHKTHMQLHSQQRCRWNYAIHSPFLWHMVNAARKHQSMSDCLFSHAIQEKEEWIWRMGFK